MSVLALSGRYHNCPSFTRDIYDIVPQACLAPHMYIIKLLKLIILNATLA